MGPSMAVRGGTTSGVFETPMEKVLAPALRPGQIVVMDKLGAHRPGRVRELIEERGCELCCTCAFLLPGSQPDRRSLRQGQAYPEGDRSPRQGGSHRGDGSSIGSGEHRRRAGVLRSLRLPPSGAAAMKGAVRTPLARSAQNTPSTHSAE